jgi:hypothetical protein
LKKGVNSFCPSSGVYLISLQREVKVCLTLQFGRKSFSNLRLSQCSRTPSRLSIQCGLSDRRIKILFCINRSGENLLSADYFKVSKMFHHFKIKVNKDKWTKTTTFLAKSQRHTKEDHLFKDTEDYNWLLKLFWLLKIWSCLGLGWVVNPSIITTYSFKRLREQKRLEGSRL